MSWFNLRLVHHSHFHAHVHAHHGPDGRRGRIHDLHGLVGWAHRWVWLAAALSFEFLLHVRTLCFVEIGQLAEPPQ
jgi:hypothetical protein